MDNTDTLRTLALVGAIGVAGYEVGFPNTEYDQFMTKNVWCEEGTVAQQPTVFAITSGRELDHVFGKVDIGDTLRYGDIDLVAVDARPQELSWRGDSWIADRWVKMGCNGYMVFDAYHDEVKVGEDIELVYAAKFLGAGGLFDGWPDFTLEDVLGETSLDVTSALKGASRIEEGIELDKYQKARSAIEEKYWAKVEKKPEFKAEVEQCLETFPEVEGKHTYTVKKGDNKVRISEAFQECNAKGAFYPKLYKRLDTRNGTDVERNGYSDMIYPKDKVTINAILERDMAEPQKHFGQRFGSEWTSK